MPTSGGWPPDPDPHERDLLRIHRELSSLAERITALHDHKAGASDMSRIESEFRNADFRTLQEISGQISTLRSDMREWTSNSVAAAETRIMAAIKAEGSWQKQLPIYLVIGLSLFGIATNNPHLAKLLGMAQ